MFSYILQFGGILIGSVGIIILTRSAFDRSSISGMMFLLFIIVTLLNFFLHFIIPILGVLRVITLLYPIYYAGFVYDKADKQGVLTMFFGGLLIYIIGAYVM